MLPRRERRKRAGGRDTADLTAQHSRPDNSFRVQPLPLFQRVRGTAGRIGAKPLTEKSNPVWRSDDIRFDRSAFPGSAP